MSPRIGPRTSLSRLGALALVVTVLTAAPAVAAPSAGELQGQIGGAQQREQDLRGAIGRENERISGFQGSIDDLTTRLHAIQSTLSREQTQLQTVRRDLRDARAKLMLLRRALAHDRAALAAQLVAQYELPQESVVSVVVNSSSFAGLLERVDDLDRLREQNVRITQRVTDARVAVAAETERLAGIERRRRLIAAATLVQRDEVARLRLAVVDRQLVFVRARSHDRGRLATLHDRERSLRQTLQQVQAREAAATAAAARAPSVPSGPAPTPAGSAFAAHGGATGFFQAPGTNYSVGSTPIIAARLDQLGRALGLHLEGISGYRTPQHSVEVGGFADDPHTRGEASDTPGVEGVPEGTLNEYGLTRPFGGAAEADHIQLHGG